MTEKEKIASHIATCNCCLLAQNMKACVNCQFNIGLATQVVLPVLKPLTVALAVKSPMLAA